MTILPLAPPGKFRKIEFPELPEPVSEDGKRVSEAVYWEKYYEHDSFGYEWCNGKLEAIPMSDFLNCAVYLWFLRLLDAFLETYPMARMITLETGFRLATTGQKSVRKPDIGIVLNNNPIPLGDKDYSYKGIFDLCVESLSDSNRQGIKRDTVQKKKEYAQAGVAEYYILDESRRNTRFYRLSSQGIYVRVEPPVGVIQSSTLSGFQFRVEDLYCQPSLIEMATDEVYKGFVLPEFQAAMAEAERQKAENLRLLAKLKSLGVSPD